jgi:hypothetical protein
VTRLSAQRFLTYGGAEVRLRSNEPCVGSARGPQPRSQRNDFTARKIVCGLRDPRTPALAMEPPIIAPTMQPGRIAGSPPSQGFFYFAPAYEIRLNRIEAKLGDHDHRLPAAGNLDLVRSRPLAVPTPDCADSVSVAHNAQDSVKAGANRPWRRFF